jgi:hypothetical protein
VLRSRERARGTRRAAGPGGPSCRSAAARPPKSVRPLARARAAAPPPPQEARPAPELDQISAKITSLRADALGRLSFVLDNGQVWRMTESEGRVRLPPTAGDTVTIRRGEIGGYRLDWGTKIGVARSRAELTPEAALRPPGPARQAPALHKAASMIDRGGGARRAIAATRKLCIVPNREADASPVPTDGRSVSRKGRISHDVRAICARDKACSGRICASSFERARQLVQS